MAFSMTCFLLWRAEQRALKKCPLGLKQQRATTTQLLEWTKAKTDSSECWQGRGATEMLTHCWWECKIQSSYFAATLKDSLQFLTKLNIFLPYDPAVVALGI